MATKAKPEALALPGMEDRELTELKNAALQYAAMISRRFKNDDMQEGSGRLARGIREVAALFSVSVDTLRRAADRGDLRVIRISKRLLVPEQEVQRLLREGISRRTANYDVISIKVAHEEEPVKVKVKREDKDEE
jgi:excisionase family DNA binding protein